MLFAGYEASASRGLETGPMFRFLMNPCRMEQVRDIAFAVKSCHRNRRISSLRCWTVTIYAVGLTAAIRRHYPTFPAALAVACAAALVSIPPLRTKGS